MCLLLPVSNINRIDYKTKRKIKFRLGDLKSVSDKHIPSPQRKRNHPQMGENAASPLSRKRSTSFRIQKTHQDLYQDQKRREPKPKISVPKNMKSRYDKFNIKKVREEFNQGISYPGVKQIDASKQAKMNSTNNTDYNSDYLRDDISVFKVTFDNNSTTVTDMGNSGFSFTEAHGTTNPRMNRSMSYSHVSKNHSSKLIGGFLPIINQYQRAMNSPVSTSSKVIQFEDIAIL